MSGLLDLIRGAHGLYYSDDPDYYRDMGYPHRLLGAYGHPGRFGGFGGYGGFGGSYNHYGDSTFGRGLGHIGSFLSEIAPIVHYARNYKKLNERNRGAYDLNNPPASKVAEQQREFDRINARNGSMNNGTQDTSAISTNGPQAQALRAFNAKRDLIANMGSRINEGVQGLGSAAYNAMPEVRRPVENLANRAVSNLSPFSGSTGGGWDSKRNNDYQKASDFYQDHYAKPIDSSLGDSEGSFLPVPEYKPSANVQKPHWTAMYEGVGDLFNEDSQPRINAQNQSWTDSNGMPSFAKGGSTKQYYVKEKMPGYDVGRVVPNALAQYWNPRLDPVGVAGNALGAEGARMGANYGINRLMGTDGHKWSAPRGLSRMEQLKKFFTHKIPKIMNKNFGTHFDTSRYHNAKKGAPLAIENQPGLLQQGVSALGNQAANMGSRINEGVQGLGSAAYNAMPEVRRPVENLANRAVSNLSPFSGSTGGNWDMDPNFRPEDMPPQQSYMSRAYNALPNLGISDYFSGNKPAMSLHDSRQHMSDGMKQHHPVQNQSGMSAPDRFVGDNMFGGNHDNGMEEYHGNGDEFQDANDDEFYDARDHYASGGYTGNIGEDEFVHRRHHKVNQPDGLEEMIRAYIAHMMEQQAAGREEE